MKIKTLTILVSIVLFSTVFANVNSYEKANTPQQYPRNSSSFTIPDLNWTEGAFIPHYINGTAEETTEDFNSSITSSEIHIYETSSSYYHLFAGVYCIIPASKNTMNVSFEGRANSSRYDQIIMGIGIINPSNMSYLSVKRPYDYQDTGISSPHDTGYNPFSYNFSINGYEEILLFLFYIEATVANWAQNVWFKNLTISFHDVITTPNVKEITNYSLLILISTSIIVITISNKLSKKIKKYS